MVRLSRGSVGYQAAHRPRCILSAPPAMGRWFGASPLAMVRQQEGAQESAEDVQSFHRQHLEVTVREPLMMPGRAKQQALQKSFASKPPLFLKLVSLRFYHQS